MCSYCQTIHFNMPVKVHTVLDCPTRQSEYCHICCAKGHKTTRCPNRKALAIRNGLDPDSVQNYEISVKNDKNVIGEMLMKHGITPFTSLSENISLLQNIGNSMSPPHKIVFTP